MTDVTSPPPAARRRYRTSLTAQLVLLAVLPTLLVSGVLIALTTRQYLRGVQEHTRQQAKAVAVQLAATAQLPLALEDRRALLRIAESGMTQPHVQQVQIWSGEGELMANVDTRDLRRTNGVQVTAPALASPGQMPGHVQVNMSLEPLRAAQRRAWGSVLAAVAACLGAVLLVGGWAARRISAPVRALATAVDRLGAGEPAQVKLGGAPEVVHLQQGFNAAAQALHEHRTLLEQRIREATAELAHKNAQIERASQAKTRLLAAASHDLRQPLHALGLFSDGLARSETDPARLARIRHLCESVQSLDKLFSELMNITQIDAGVLTPRWSDFALDRVFDEVSRNFRPVAESRELRLVVRHTPLRVHADYFMLTRILGNLVSNALRHTHAGGVLVAARCRAAVARIDVVDTGVGIAPEHQQRIFEEFYQVNAAAPDDTDATAGQAAPGADGPGMGLGLATVQRLAGLLGVRVQLGSRPGRGTWVRLEVPLADLPSTHHQPARARLSAPAAHEGYRSDTALASSLPVSP
ncbi:MAG: HAMP domain-containing sensor histidine kinase [Pseudomonadota bacterium]|nr:HAMP domain-containing sensor histidine kinase [Pseudomonadota bacterium]